MEKLDNIVMYSPNEYGKVFNFYQRKEKEKYINYVTDGISEI